MAKIINMPLTEEVVNDLKAGDRVLLNGIIYT
ncbi:MAG TPA: TRZ/ATZ family protein, partial [Sedimentibacter sp.]|nr:TRZ/ATZ family protein [Sedimentibacter sp.]